MTGSFRCMQVTSELITTPISALEAASASKRAGQLGPPQWLTSGGRQRRPQPHLRNAVAADKTAGW